MKQRLAGALVVVIIAALAVWWFAVRGKPAPASHPTPPAVPTKVDVAKTAATPEQTAPQGVAPRWIRDVDREGPLRLEGQVIDEAGAGVGGAIVTLSSVPPRTATTEGDGSFSFDKLVGREYALTAIAGKLVGGPITHHLTAASDPAVIRLSAGAKLTVTVVDGDDKPIAKASVKTTGLSEQTATTADDGTATLEPVHPGWVTVQAHATGYATGSGFVQIGGAGGSGQVKLTLRPGYAVSGRVVDEHGKPIAGARVTTAGIWDLPGAAASADTDAKGHFAITALPPGTHTLVASDGDHEPTRSAPITIDNHPIDGIELVMQAGGTLAGTVVDGKGAAVAFATVRVSGDGQQMWIVDSRQASSDKSGAFELRGLARTKLKVRAESDAAASAVVPIDLTTQPDKRDLKLVLDVAGTIAGLVVDETGQPVPEVQVNAFPDLLSGSNPDAMVLAGMSSATTDGAGHFTIHGLPDGAYRLRAARSSGRGRYDWGQQGVPAKTGDTSVKITLAAPGTITGKVVLENGNAPALANVQLGYQAAEAARRDGSFTLGDVTPGTYDLRVRGPEFAEFVKQDVVVAPGKPTDVGTLTLIRGRKVTGRVVDAKGNGVGGATVKSGDMLYSMQGAEDQTAALEDMAGMRRTTSGPDGSFTLIGIAKKTTNVLADHPTRGRSNALAIPAGTDDPPALTLTLRGFGSVSGTVTSQGKPLGGATITASPKGGGTQLQVAQSEGNGTFALAKVPEGTVVVSAMQQSGLSQKSTSTEVAVQAGKTTTVTIDIPVGSVTLAVSVKPLPTNKVDAAQIFLLRGIVAIKNAKELTDVAIGGAMSGMKFWFGPDKPIPEFDELVPGDYSVCSVPITGDINDPTLQQRLQANMATLAVYCKQVKVTPSPAKQTFVHELPSMTPLPQ